MSVRTCLLLGCLAALLGLGLRLGLPVRPVDEAYRATVRDVLAQRRLVVEQGLR
ncbi:hypothetical protein M446_4414 [Methylobacterium sp. 4-46]|uniref:hypothetical protein n=1 Tax=unclassified Methylobacterium TaxID=2615210 RepID=UPI000165CC7F|nr:MULTISPECIES: hypothetical protein [Methylobacterium]ACA18756.1 hypothetical protein M446_4414 [Methylobacterium sp. 4-46]WFT77986.1 hypothetical protein QA634_22150 [Methylobacterium nodulans]